MTEEEQIRNVIEGWADAVHRGDLERCWPTTPTTSSCSMSRRRTRGSAGLAAYTETWPPFFEWQAAGASFTIESLEVTAGTDVAFAVALLRCGTDEEFAENPDRRLRLTVGLRKVDGRWVVTHEHHSFPFDRSRVRHRDLESLGHSGPPRTRFDLWATT